MDNTPKATPAEHTARKKMNIRYRWAPSIPLRILAIIISIGMIVLGNIIYLENFAQALLVIVGVVGVYYGLDGLIRRPRVIVTDEKIIFRRTFRPHIYPLYTLHGFRIDRPKGLFRNSALLSFDIARVEEWERLREKHELLGYLPLPLPDMNNRQRDLLEVVTTGDLGGNIDAVAEALEECGIRHLETETN